MYAPDKSVLRPEIPPTPRRGRTTQKRVSSRKSFVFSRSSLAITLTLSRSSLSVTASTSPTSTLRELSLVLPASIPSAVSKVIVISGPSVMTV